MRLFQLTSVNGIYCLLQIDSSKKEKLIIFCLLAKVWYWSPEVPFSQPQLPDSWTTKANGRTFAGFAKQPGEAATPVVSTS